MKLSKSVSGALALGCVFAVVGSGCVHKNPKNTTGTTGQIGDVLKPEDMKKGSDVGMEGVEHFEGGILVTNAKVDNVLFAYDSYQVDNAELSKVEAVADYMKKNADVKLVAEGNCDERGSSEYNMSLGEHRALGVRAHLVRLGIDGTRMQTRSYGKEKPLVEGHNEAAWRQNRRVEFKLYK